MLFKMINFIIAYFIGAFAHHLHKIIWFDFTGCMIEIFNYFIILKYYDSELLVYSELVSKTIAIATNISRILIFAMLIILSIVILCQYENTRFVYIYIEFLTLYTLLLAIPYLTYYMKTRNTFVKEELKKINGSFTQNFKFFKNKEFQLSIFDLIKIHVLFIYNYLVNTVRILRMLFDNNKRPYVLYKIIKQLIGLC